jgi:hypothetical protein
MARMLGLLVALTTLAAPAAASAGTPLYGLTQDQRIVRLDLDQPDAAARAVPVSGMREGERAVGLFTDRSGEMWLLTSATRKYRLDPWSGQVSGLIPGATTDQELQPTLIPSDRHVGLMGLDLFLVVAGDKSYSPGQASNPYTEPSRTVNWNGAPTPALAESPSEDWPRPDLVALAPRTFQTARGQYYGVAVDAATDQLVHFAEGSIEAIGALGVDVGAPTGLETIATDVGVLVTADGNRSQVRRIDYTTGASTLIGHTPAGTVLLDVATIEPPAFVVRTPTLIELSNAAEGEAGVVPVVRIGDPEPRVTVTVTPAQGAAAGVPDQATPGGDFDPTPQTLTFEPGQRTASAAFPLPDDNVPEPWEGFTAFISPGPGAVLSRVGVHSMGLTITDNDTAFPAAVTVDESAGSVQIPLTRPVTGIGGLTVSPTIAGGGTATAGSDFDLRTPTVAFGFGATRMPVALQIRQDIRSERPETVYLRVGRFTGSTVKVTIRDDDRSARVTLGRKRFRVGKTVPVTVTCPTACSGSLEVRRGSKRLVRRAVTMKKAARRTYRLRLPRKARGGKATVRLTLKGRKAITARVTLVR